ncbi:Lrp/AsnC family transcriptional regulator [Ferrovibrio sp.]|uniref:Lrp/AsnC family transcriptional regulator n=1 Tax=Ferrovibrio sp. TaxID=1917215 RepID=UPI0025C3C583|nr:Lrp/AsnC family transcriptional regulator [Ferrovibrio sp.]
MDSIDRHILGILQEDAALPVQVVAERVGLSPNPCWRRIKQLEAAGVIERRVALVNAAAVGLGVTAFVSIRTNQHNADWLQSFARGVQSIPEIVECHRMSGDIDYLLKVVVRDIQHYDRVYRRLIAAVPGLSDVSSTFSMERLKHGTKLELATL